MTTPTTPRRPRKLALAVRVTPGQADRLRAESERTGLHLSELVRRLIDEALPAPK